MQTSLKTVLKSLIIIALLILWPNALAYNTNLNQFKNGRNIKEALYEPGQVLVKFKQDISKSQQEQIKDKAGVKKTLETIRFRGKQKTQLLKLGRDENVEKAILILEKQDSVEYAEPNYIGWAAFTPNDTFFGNQWGLNNIDMPEAWDNIGDISNPSVIAVLDSGIDFTHPDLRGQIWTNDDYNDFNWANISQNFYFKGPPPFEYFYYLLGKETEPAITEFAQSFKGNGGYIKEISVALKRKGTPSQDIKVSIRESNLEGSGPGEDDLRTVNINPETDDIITYWTTSGTGNFISKTLSSPLEVNSGDTYYIVVSTDQDDENYYELGCTKYDSNDNADRFPDGRAFIKNGSWQDMDKDDLAFKLIFDTQKNDGLGGGIPRDDNGHGTHVSGIAAAVTDNNEGVAGIAGFPANAVKIMPLRVLDSQGFGNYLDWSEAIKYAADNGANIINMSLVGSYYSQTLQDAVNDAVGKGAIVIAAAGNNGGSAISYPAGLENVVGVSSTTNTDALASTSNYNASVDLSAPGENIYSTTPTYPHYKSTGINKRAEKYDFYSGTSMATPAVSALAALIKAKWPDYTPIQIQQTMQDNADDLGDDGRDDYFGYGRINAVRIFDNIPPSVTINTTSEDPTNSSSIPITINFSEAVKGFEANDISVGNGAVQNLTGVGATYATDIIPAADGAVSVNINAGVALDEAGNQNTAAPELLRTYDSTPPSISLSSETANPTNDLIEVNAEFSENVTGFEVSDIKLMNADVEAFNKIDEDSYVFKVDPIAGGNTNVLISISAGMVTDIAGNDNILSNQLSYISDTAAPMAIISSPSIDPTNLSPIPITINFNEPVKGFEASDIYVANGVVQNFSGDGQIFSADIIPSADGEVRVNVNAGVAQDEAGNQNTAAPELLRTYDSTLPKIEQGLTAQSSGQYVRGVIKLKTNATDNIGISKLSYYIDSLNALIGTSYSSPYLVSWDTRKNRNGNRNVLTYAYDAAGNQSNTETLLRIDNYKPRTYAPYRQRVKRGRVAKLYWKAYDPYTGNRAYVKLKIQKRVKSRANIRRRARYLKLFRIWRSRYLRTRNRTLKKRYAYNKYLRAYRRTSPYVYRTAKNVNYRWTTINRLRYYRQRFNHSGTYRFLVYAKDLAGNWQFNVARNNLVVK